MSSFGESWLLHFNTGVSVNTNLFEAQPADDEARGLGEQAESTGFRAHCLRPRRVEIAPERAPPREAAELPHEVPPPRLRPCPHCNRCSTNVVFWLPNS